MNDGLTIDELAIAAGLSRRGIRFYVQQKLLPPPLSLGRNARYSRDHLERLNRITQLQSAGHSLDEIRRVLEGKAVSNPAPARPIRRTALRAELVSRISLLQGIEVTFDASRYQPTAEDLEALRDFVRTRFQQEGDAHD